MGKKGDCKWQRRHETMVQGSYKSVPFKLPTNFKFRGLNKEFGRFRQSDINFNWETGEKIKQGIW